MKKVAVLIMVIGVLAFGSVHSRLNTVNELMYRWSAICTWATPDPEERHFQAGIQMLGIVRQMESELVEAIQEATTPFEAEWVFHAVCQYTAAHLGTVGMLELDTAKMTTATELTYWINSQIEQLPKWSESE